MDVVCAALFSHFNGNGGGGADDDDGDNVLEDSYAGGMSLLLSSETVGQIKCDINSDTAESHVPGADGVSS